MNCSLIHKFPILIKEEPLIRGSSGMPNLDSGQTTYAICMAGNPLLLSAYKALCRRERSTGPILFQFLGKKIKEMLLASVAVIAHVKEGRYQVVPDGSGTDQLLISCPEGAKEAWGKIFSTSLGK